MAETTADVRRDIELTRERMSSTIEELEQKLNVKQMIVEHPWPALALAVGAGVLLSGSRADVKAAAATATATRGASAKLGTALDDVMGNLMAAVNGAIQGRVDQWVDEIKTVIGAPQRGTPVAGNGAGANELRSDIAAVRPREVPRAD
ncbi:MAG: DUF3618 domain-containing protein [Gemmatimonadaceae bacterium]